MSVEVLCTIVSTAVAVLVLLIDCQRTRTETREQIARIDERMNHHEEKIDFIKEELDNCKSEPPNQNAFLHLKKHRNGAFYLFTKLSQCLYKTVFGIMSYSEVIKMIPIRLVTEVEVDEVKYPIRSSAVDIIDIIHMLDNGKNAEALMYFYNDILPTNIDESIEK